LFSILLITRKEKEIKEKKKKKPRRE